MQEIASVFAALAFNLQREDPNARDEAGNLEDLISNVNRSVNLSESPGVRVLDTALSLMCFTASQVFDSVNEYMVRTVVTILSSSIQCKALKNGEDENLQVGGTISSRDIVETIGACGDMFQKLERNRDLCHLVLHALARVVVLESPILGLTPNACLMSNDAKTSAFAKLLRYLPKELNIQSGEVPTRLLIWYLEPRFLKHNISQILQEATARPFLCLKTEFFERPEWHSFVVCLAISPATFIETQTLLHNWFLLTGLASVLELQATLVYLILDIVSRPMGWGLSMEVGSKIPFSHAYFPTRHLLLRILTGPFSLKNLHCLVEELVKSVSHVGRHLRAEDSQATTKISVVDRRSIWSMVITFPDWILFASLMLFTQKRSLEGLASNCSSDSPGTERIDEVEMPCSTSAMRFLAWIFSPMGDSDQDLLFHDLVKLLESWTLKQFSSDKHIACTSRFLREDSTATNGKKVDAINQVHDQETLQVWLKEFEDVCSGYCRRGVNISTNWGQSPRVRIHQSMLFRKILFGLLTGCSYWLDEGVYKLILHYIVTGNIFQLPERQEIELKNKGRLNLRPSETTDQYNKHEAVMGVCVVFDLIDSTERLSASIFETEEKERDLICLVKSKSENYLINCVKRLLELELDEEDGLLPLRDLYNRMVSWRHRGQNKFDYSNKVDDIISILSAF